MYKRILAAVNEHINSEVSARYAVELAKVTGSRIFFCTVADNSMSEAALRHAEEALSRLFNLAKDADVRAESILVSGSPLEEIKKIARSEKIDIVFAATRHEDLQKRFYRGTTARGLSVSLTCSVALVRVVHMGKIHPRKILLPLKEKVNHIPERAYFAAKMAEASGSTILLFHSTKPISRFFHGELHLTPLDWENRMPADIADFLSHLDRYEVTYEKRSAPGRTARNITIEAAAKRHDLIIMGASERNLLSSMLRGSPVEEVLRETPCDLIILKPRHEDK
ncbi:MAG: universal stress protein [Nitrospirae bacterium]|nr:universal stress protein [Nitrospirota bacterium]